MSQIEVTVLFIDQPCLFFSGSLKRSGTHLHPSGTMIYLRKGNGKKFYIFCLGHIKASKECNMLFTKGLPKTIAMDTMQCT